MRSIMLVACLLLFSSLAMAQGRARGSTTVAIGNIPLPEQSAGVFIGVEKFSHDYSLTNVSYAVDDAIDLAYSLSIERGLLPPNRVLLLLAGEPTKEDSRQRLKELTAPALGAKQGSARQADIYSSVEEQSKLVGERGVLIVSIATHGYSDDNGHLLLAEDSLLKFRTGITAEKLLKATEGGAAAPRIFFVDACRSYLFKSSQRGGNRGSDVRSAMRNERIDAIAQRPGYVVFSAASEGQYANSSASSGNGLFTGAIVAGLSCQRHSQSSEAKTFQELTKLVRQEVERQDNGQQPALREESGIVDFAFPPCHSRGTRPPGPRNIAVPAALLAKIEDAANLYAVGGWGNIEQSFRLYWEAFKELPPPVRATLNQGLVNKAAQLKEDSQRKVGIQIYQDLLNPLIAPSRTNLP